MTKQITDLLISIKKQEEVDEFFNNLFTKSELETLRKRWRILELLNSGLTQREISKELNVSLCKVTRGAKILKNKNSIIHHFLKGENNE